MASIDQIQRPMTEEISNISYEKSSGTLVKHMQALFMSPKPEETQSLHTHTLGLPFYKNLMNKDISADKLLLHFANNAAIFNKLETLIKTNKVFQQIFDEGIFRYPQVEKDIQFFSEKFELSRPEITADTQEFLNFIDTTFKQNADLLLAVLYVQYSGLFLGRAVFKATESWLKEQKRIRDWDKLPQDERGLSYWDFKGLTTAQDLMQKKEKIIDAINEYGEKLPLKDELQAIAGQSFEHNFRCIQSVYSTKLPLENT